MNINQEHLKKLVSDFKKKSDELKDIINPILNKNTLPQKEILEVCQVAKFSKDINESIKIIEKGFPPSPDFIIEHKGFLKGLEHTRIFNSKGENISKIRSLIEYSERIFLETYPELNILIYISIREGFDFKQHQKKNIAEIIVDTIYKKYLGKEYQMPPFLTQLKMMSHSLLVFEYEENYAAPEYLPKELLITRVKNKENNIEKYKRGESGLKEYWLLLLLDTTSSTSYVLDKNADYSLNTSFDRVYLMEDLGSKIIRIN
ncbi:hypothetical protein SAMN05421636_108279 [Pricia antarctica]|uniref:Uncharacterized protein n=1 Tax=Pricia antarctica TaxID=641691 RepID=A0A1G7GT84_9FLAO|nr:hypothetical protein [Pricia antarctica]SDE91360.1 hypothetical protein SAMN05421636_108279 [Pricia antarctica]